MADLPKENKLNVELTEDIGEGLYSNLAVITHSHTEFIVDFVNIMPGLPKAKVKARVILTPHHAKRLMHALKDNVTKYEAAYGEIKEHDLQVPPFKLVSPAGEA